MARFVVLWCTMKTTGGHFWQTLPRPFFVLAPMEDVTDAAFRFLIAKTAKPHVMYTEFTSADGMVLAPEPGKSKILKKLLYDTTERPIVAQLFTAHPDHMEAAAKMAAEMGFDGIDINMGCPVNEVVDNGCGAALIKNPQLARELMRAVKRGAPHLPLSVKTRVGFNEDTLDTWLPELLAEEPAVVTIHARTRKDMSKVPARWERVKRAVEIRNALGSNTLIVGNGDVTDVADARKKAAETGCDGVMLARAIYGNPWLFSETVVPPTPQEKVVKLIEHIQLYQELLPGNHFAVMKKHFKAYISGWDNAKELRVKLMETNTPHDAIQLLKECI